MATSSALGLRAVHLGLELLLTQLRSIIVRASAHGPLMIMVPIIASTGELRAVRALFDRAVHDVDAAAHRLAPHIPLGMVVDVPSADCRAHGQ